MTTPIATTCCIAGGGPAGMMLGYLLARAGVDVTVLEKHADFLRDFRGDTVHPSTLEIFHELGLLEKFLQRPHQKLRAIEGQIGDTRAKIADFSHTPTHCHFIAFMPQWEFLDFLADEAKTIPHFHLMMQARATDIIEQDDRVTGVNVETQGGNVVINADLVVAADGRHSIIRDRAKLPVEDLGSPIDVLWFRLPKRANDEYQTLGNFNYGRILVMLDRGDYWQSAFVIRKGALDKMKTGDIQNFRNEILKVSPQLKQHVAAIESWDDVKLLTVTVNRLKQWSKPGLLCIGDAAHAMSPVGGVGINLAIQDAVATANLLHKDLHNRTLTPRQLRKVQKRRALPTRLIQQIQIMIQTRMMDRILGDDHPVTAPLPILMLNKFPFLRRIPARIVGVGFRPEHVRTPKRA